MRRKQPKAYSLDLRGDRCRGLGRPRPFRAVLVRRRFWHRASWQVWRWAASFAPGGRSDEEQSGKETSRPSRSQLKHVPSRPCPRRS